MNSSSEDPTLTLAANGVGLVLKVAIGEPPAILHFGKHLPRTDAGMLSLMTRRQWVFGGANRPIDLSLSAEPGTGHLPLTGLDAHRAGRDFAQLLAVTAVEKEGRRARIHCRDERAGLAVTYHLAMTEAGVVTAGLVLTNTASEPLTVNACAPLTVPLDDRFSRLKTFHGRWAGEFQTRDIELGRGGFIKENRAGRTHHDGVPALIAMEETTGEHQGRCAAFHLAWSGNNRVRAEHFAGGTSAVQLSELLLSGEMILEEGETYETPDLVMAWSGDGLNGLSQTLHRHVRHQVLSERSRTKPRPVHYNTWEAVYFDHREDKLRALAERAAAVGAERFVLDDGWFGGRRGDAAGLGDWRVSGEVYPQGLGALADHVRSLGMEFGIWFEPEMVNPDSDLFRRHPDWVLGADGPPDIPFRNQLTLDLTRAEVSDYLFSAMDDIIRQLKVSYIKWDMNRDTHVPGGADGRPVMHRQTRAVYALIARLREAHPGLEIESCSSGGGRTDYGILAHTDRLWTSDSNDALERQAIQRGASLLFPCSVLGSHVGPRVCHITGRSLPMHLRAATAVFGHMGLEVDLADETEDDLRILKSAIDLYKEHRALLHGGREFRLGGPEGYIARMVSDDAGAEALVSAAKTASHPDTLPGRLRLAGLKGDASYIPRLVWPLHMPTLTAPSVIDRLRLREGGVPVTGEALMETGLQLPWTFPETCLLIHLQKTDE